jgi:peptidoglycan/LPS O-acetylase OafA/YrhL
MKPQAGRIEQIDVLRGLAAIVVMLFHYTTRYDQMFPEKAGWTILNVFWGSYGVHLFFIVSGFVIFMTIERSLNRFDFIVSRLSRLYPVYWAALILTVMFDFANPALGFHPTFGQIVVNLTMLQDFVRVAPIDGSYWSLTYELGFYSFMCFFFGNRVLKRPAYIAVFWAVASVIFHFLPGLFPGGLNILAVTHKYGHLFSAGVAFYWLYSRGFSRTFHDISLALIIIVSPGIEYLHTGFPGFWSVLGSVALVAAATQGKLSWITNPVTLWLGSISYPLYLIHEHIGWHLLSVQQNRGMSAGFALMLTIAIMLGLATLLSRLIEKPAQRRIRNWYSRFKAKNEILVS